MQYYKKDFEFTKREFKIFFSSPVFLLLLLLVFPVIAAIAMVACHILTRFPICSGRIGADAMIGYANLQD